MTMFLKNLDKLISERKINKHILSEESGIPYSTIDGFYKKGYNNTKLSTLIKLSEYFGVSLDYLVKGEVTTVTGHEKSLVNAYRANPSMQEAVDKLLGVPAENKNSIGADIAAELRAQAKNPISAK